MRHPWLVWLSLSLALIWQYWPLPLELRVWLPDLTVIVCLFWLVRTPHGISAFTIGFIGLARDILDQNSMLGPHLLALSLTAYFALVLRNRFISWHLSGQWLAACVLISLYFFCCHWVLLLDGSYANKDFFWQPLVSTALVWPVCFALLRRWEESYSPISSAS